MNVSTKTLIESFEGHILAMNTTVSYVSTGQSTESINHLFQPNVTPGELNSIPAVLMQTALEANMLRFTHFCSQQYVPDPRCDQRTAKIYTLIELIKAQVNKIRNEPI